MSARQARVHSRLTYSCVFLYAVYIIPHFYASFCDFVTKYKIFFGIFVFTMSGSYVIIISVTSVLIQKSISFQEDAALKQEYGISIHSPDETVFQSGLFQYAEFSAGVDFTKEDAFTLWEKVAEETAETAQKYNLPIRSYHLPFNGERHGGAYPFTPSAFREDMREFTLENSLRLIRRMAEYGVRYVILHGSLRIPEEERADRLLNLIDYTGKLCDACKPLGITVALETLLPSCLGRNSEEHLQVMKSLNRENLGTCFDCNHFLEEDPCDFLLKAGQHVVTTHLSDYDGVNERHWMPGQGILDWKKLITLLREKGYRGPHVFEIRFANKVPTHDELKQLISTWETFLT